MGCLVTAVRKAFAVFHVTDTCTVVVTAATSASRARWRVHSSLADLDLCYTFTGWRSFRVPELDEWAASAPSGSYGLTTKYVPGGRHALAAAIERRTGVRCR